MTPSLLRATTALCLAIVGTITLTADYKQSFQKGVQASNRRNWVEAVRFFEQALAERSAETGENVQISGMDFKPYLPHFYLGLARMNNNDCVGALAAWQTSESQGAISKMREYGVLVRSRTACQARVAKQESTTPAQAPSAPSVPAPQAPPATAVTAPLIDRGQAPDPIGIRPGNPQPEETPTEKSANPAASHPKDDLKPIPTSSVVPSSSPVDGPTAIAANPRPSVPQRQPNVTAIERPPKELLTAARLFFNAQYQEAASALMAARFDSRPAATQAALFRAAALHALYLLGGEKDNRLLEQASNEVRTCRRLDPKLVPNARVFSPRFVDFFLKTP